MECILIDEKLFKNSKKKLKFYKINVLKEISKTIKILQKIREENKNKNNIFIFSNPIVFTIYFLYIKLFFNNKKIFFFAHSHLTKKNTLLYLCTFLCGIFFLLTNKIFYVSKFTKKYWVKKYFFPKFARSTIQYNSVELSKKTKKFNNSKFRIGFVGRAETEKGLNKFLKIAYENRNNFIFNIFSSNKVNLNKNQMKYVKFFLNKDASIIYKNIDLLLVTSPTENCPFSVLEAKSYSIPTLVYLTTGGINELIRNNYDGIIIKSKKKLKIVDFINKIRFNYKYFSRNAYISAKKYNSDIQIPKLIENELLK